MDWTTHVHDNVPGGGISFDAVLEPTAGRARTDMKLQQVKDTGTHRGRGVAQNIPGVSDDLFLDVDVSQAPCLVDRGDGDVGRVDATEPSPEDEERVADLGWPFRAVDPLHGNRAG